MVLRIDSIEKPERKVFGRGTHPNRHRVFVQYLHRHLVLYSGFRKSDGTPRTTDRKHKGVGVHGSSSARVELPIDIFGQARDAEWVLLRAREAEAEW
jgi:hypothetical protein